MYNPVLTDEQLSAEVEPVLKALRPAPILWAFLIQWVVLAAVIGFGTVWASEVPWSDFHPSLAWILTVVLGPGIISGGSALTRVWAVRRYLTRTTNELREQVSKDWSVLTGPGWFGRMIRFSLAASVVAGGTMGTLLSIRFPGDRFLGSTIATLGAMTGMYLVTIIPLAFGMRSLLVRKIVRRVERDLAPAESPDPREIQPGL